jgi:hypothetical protein
MLANTQLFIIQAHQLHRFPTKAAARRAANSERASGGGHYATGYCESCRRWFYLPVSVAYRRGRTYRRRALLMQAS